MSASGQYQTAVAENNYIYTSNNFGSTWTQDTSIGSTKTWRSVSISASGIYQIANGSGIIYISSIK